MSEAGRNEGGELRRHQKSRLPVFDLDRAFKRIKQLMQVMCMPMQIPKKGISRSLAYFTVAILPSDPRSPNPPGSRMAFNVSSSATISASGC